MNNKGITLVALVVTIIILIILATVTIGLILGQDSLFGKAEEGRQKTELAQIGERLNTAGAAVLIEVQALDIEFDATTEVATPTLKSALSAHLSTEDAAIVDAGTESQKTLTVEHTLGNFKMTYTFDAATNRSDHVIEKVTP